MMTPENAPARQDMGPTDPFEGNPGFSEEMDPDFSADAESDFPADADPDISADADSDISADADSDLPIDSESDLSGDEDPDLSADSEDSGDDREGTEAGDRFSFIISPEEEGQRIDKILAARIPGQSRSYLKRLIKEECIRVSGKAVKPSAGAAAGEEVTVLLPVRMLPDILPENIPLDILYEDRDVLVVNKPKDMVVHPAAGHYTGTLVNAVLWHCGDSLSGINGVLRPGIVHRIDKDTTGSIIVCKNDAAHRSIADQLACHSIVRKYHAIVLGNIKEDTLTISEPIGRDPSDRKKMAVRPDGKRAVTHVRVLERFGDYTLVECRLETGRTHQIRVHMAWYRHPLLGDTVYGSKKKSPFVTCGQCLHASILGFVHPVTGDYIETEAPLPAYFRKILDHLRLRST